MPDTVKVFVSYSHQDAKSLDSLLGYLKGLESENVEFWIGGTGGANRTPLGPAQRHLTRRVRPLLPFFGHLCIPSNGTHGAPYN